MVNHRQKSQQSPVGVASDEPVASRTRSQTTASEPVAARTRQALGSSPEMSAFADVKDDKTLNEWLHEIAFVTSTMSDPDEPQSFQVTEFRQPLQVQSHLEMPRILVQLGHTQRTWKLAPQTDPKWPPTRSSTRYQDQISVKYTRQTLRMPSFTRAPHAQPSLSNFTRWDSDFGEPTRSHGTTRLERNFPTSPQNKKTKLTHRLLYMSLRTISTPHVN